MEFFLIVLLILVPLLAGKTLADTLVGRVVRILDGDTLVLLLSGNTQEKIRLAGIDCPERKQAFGRRAKKELSERVAGEKVTIEWDKRDRWKRIVGKVIDNKGDANLALVRSGMCWWYRKYADEQSDVDQVLDEEAEGKARREGVGMGGVQEGCARSRVLSAFR